MQQKSFGVAGMPVTPHGPFRADIVGSFVRPSELVYMRSFIPKGKLSEDELRIVEDACIRRLVAEQHAHGLRTATDGEFRRTYWHLDFFWGLHGTVRTTPLTDDPLHNEARHDELCGLNDRVAFNPEHPFFDHYRFLHDITPTDMQPRMDIPAPAQLYAELSREENAASVQAHYGRHTDALIDDIARAYHQTIETFYRLGCRHLKLDDRTWGALCNRPSDDTTERLIDIYLYLNNKAIEGLPSDLTISTHVCHGHHLSEYEQVRYEPIAETLFGKEAVDTYYLEFDSHPTTDFRSLRYVSGKKKVVLGLVSSQESKMESQVTLQQCIDRAAHYLPLDRLCLSTQCGFSSTEGHHALSEDEQWEKIDFMQQVAKDVWNETPQQ